MLFQIREDSGEYTDDDGDADNDGDDDDDDDDAITRASLGDGSGKCFAPPEPRL